MLICVTVSHKSADFALLEKISPAAAQLGDLLSVAGSEPLHRPLGVVVVATCNRVEAYLEVPEPGTAAPAVGRPALPRTPATPDHHPADTQLADAQHTDAWLVRVAEALATSSGLTAAEVLPALDVRVGDAAVKHLLSVASGLESVIIGEGEIAGQVRRALESAREMGRTTSLLERLFQQAAHTQRSIKNRTELSRAGRSLVRLGLDLAEGRIADWAHARVLLVGTGAYAGASLAALRERGAHDVAVYSPSGRAERFAHSHKIRPVRARRYPRELAEATVIITCTTAEDFVVTPQLFSAGRAEQRRDLPALLWDDTPGCPVSAQASQVVLDLGLPRNVDPSVAHTPGIELLDLETIRLHAPLEELQATEQAHRMVDRAAVLFAEATQEEELAPAVVTMRRSAERILQEEIARVAGKDPDGVAAGALRHLLSRLLHTPTVRARHYARAGQSDRYVDALETLHGVRVSSPSSLPAASAEPAVTTSGTPTAPALDPSYELEGEQVLAQELDQGLEQELEQLQAG